jgi:integrase
MARAIRRLTAVGVKSLSTPGKHADGDGLYLHVTESGAKSWRIIYVRHDKRVELGIGSARVVPLAEAREKAADARRLLASGQDPKEVWRKAKGKPDAHTFGSVALDLIQSREQGWKNPKHRQQWRNTLKTYAAPMWDKPVADVTLADVIEILEPIWTTKAETARRVRCRIENVLDVAKVRQLRSGENPARLKGNLELLLAKQRKGPKRHHPAMPFAQVPPFFLDLRARKGLSARALELTVLTAARTSEVLQARWDEFDLENGLWIVPATRMQAGKEHRVPLSEAAVEVLRGLDKNTDYVFPGLKRGKPLCNMAMQTCLKRMKLGHFTVHGFRSSFRDWCGEVTDFPREVAEQALAHTIGNEVERAYRRSDALEKRRELMQLWSQFVSRTGRSTS